MAYRCDRCGKGSLRGNKIGRARQGLNYRSPKISKPNLHPYAGVLEGKSGKWRLCTKCLRVVKLGGRPVDIRKTVESKTS